MTNSIFQAPGEAEAELAYLNRIGVIDAILSDDSDTFLFGASLVVRKCASRSQPVMPRVGLTSAAAQVQTLLAIVATLSRTQQEGTTAIM